MSVEKNGRPLPLFAETTIWVAIERRSLGIYGDCNTIDGELRLTPSRLGLSVFAQTAKGCEPAEFEQRDELLASSVAAKPRWTGRQVPDADRAHRLVRHCTR